MVIRGFLKTTLLDYPRHVASTVFLGGCNMRCRFCHNMDIVEDATPGNSVLPDVNIVDDAIHHNAQDENDDIAASFALPDVKMEIYSCDDILKHLSKRKGIIDGVCITGGEPTLYNDLPDFIKEIKTLGLLVKLDTNGTNPVMLKKLIDEKLIDYVAMDIKSSFDKYDEICGRKCNLDAIRQSINILLSLDLDYEFRTTIVSEYHDLNEIKKIGNMIDGAKNYYFQAFTDSGFVPDHTLHAPDKSTLEEYASVMREYVGNVQIRGVE